MTRLNVLKYSGMAAVFLVAGGAAQSALALDFGGYFRSGAGSNSGSGRQVCFQDPGSPQKFRLGNECETYAEIILSQQVWKTDSGASATAHTRVAYSDPQEAGYSAYQSVNMVEAYVTMDDLFGGVLQGADFWAGKRFYRQGGTGIDDYHFWSNTGPGGGITNINLGGVAKLDYGFFVNTNSLSNQLVKTYTTEDGRKFNFTSQGGQYIPNDRASAQTHLLRVHGIKTNPGGSVMVQAQFNWANGESGKYGHNGYALYAMHTQKEFAGPGSQNRFAVQYGQGSAAVISPVPNTGLSQHVKTIQVLDDLVINPTKRFNMEFVGVFRHVSGSQSELANNGLAERWFEVGARPVYYLNKYFRLNLEVGSDWTHGGVVGDQTDRLTKITFAPAVVAGENGFFSSPELRAFVTYANWNHNLGPTAVIAGDSRAGDVDARTLNPFDHTHGFTYGLQAEVGF